MSGKLRDYRVLDVMCGGTFYKVQHKVTNEIFAWRALDCAAYSEEQVQAVAVDVRAVAALRADALLRYHHTIAHAPSKTLYLVVEHCGWRSLAQLAAQCGSARRRRHAAEGFVWRLLRELALVCKAVAPLRLRALRRRLAPEAIYVGEGGRLRVDCFAAEGAGGGDETELVRAAGAVCEALVAAAGGDHSGYSDDLRDVIAFVAAPRDHPLPPDAVLYHPTLLAHLHSADGPDHITDILVEDDESPAQLEVNKCDSEKAVELCSAAIEPLPRRRFDVGSPVYSNIMPRGKISDEVTEPGSRGSLSPTLAALALELPGYVPRSRKPLGQAMAVYKPQQVSEDTLSQQWMSRLIALRQREESLNQRERDLIKKEIFNSPNTKFIPLRGSPEAPCESETEGASAGITLPPVVAERPPWASRRRRRRSGSSARPRSQRKSLHEDLDSSLSADPGDGSMIVTAARITQDNMPRRNIFPETSTRKVHFTPVNPFVESDESVTLTFYELERVDGDGYQVPRDGDRALRDITKFKYLDLEKLTSEKRAAMQWSHSSPSKQAKLAARALEDISNSGVSRSPSKASLSSKGSGSSRYSLASTRSQASAGSAASAARVTRQSMAAVPQTPAPDKKPKRKSLLPFKTPFKFMTSAKLV